MRSARVAVQLVLAVLVIGFAPSVNPIAPPEIHGTVRGFTVSEDLVTATVDFGTDRIVVPLLFQDGPEVQTVQYGPFRVEYYAPELYEAIDSPMQGTVLLVSGLPYEDRVNDLPADTGEWRRPVQLWSDPSLPSTLTELYSAFDRLNDPSAGPLCDETLSGLATYRDMAAEKCFVWCTGYSSMAADLLRSHGTPARRVHMAALASYLPSGVLVQSSEGHTTVERLKAGRWIWSDPTFRVSEVTLDGTPLSLTETIQALRDRPDDLIFTRFSDGRWVTSSYGRQDAAFRSSLARYITGDKELILDR